MNSKNNKNQNNKNCDHYHELQSIKLIRLFSVLRNSSSNINWSIAHHILLYSFFMTSIMNNNVYFLYLSTYQTAKILCFKALTMGLSQTKKKFLTILIH
jgi:hypothetical protein